MATRTAAAQSAMESIAAKAPETSAKKIVEATEDVFEQIRSDLQFYCAPSF